jgi:hypothetical protein
VLCWDGTGQCVFAKRRGKGRFAAPWERGEGAELQLTMSEPALLFEESEVIGRMPPPPPYTVTSTRHGVAGQITA